MTKKLIILSFIMLSLLSCRKDKREIPYYYVNFILILSQPQYANLKAPGNSMHITQNISRGQNDTPNGVIIYRLSETDFMAYEPTCTYETSESCAVQIEEIQVTARCPCCNSVYFLTDGFPTEGVSELPLMQYYAVLEGDELHVYNQ